MLVNIRTVSICGSDLKAYQFVTTRHFIQPPVIMGHECSGEVAKVGTAVTGFKPGDRVVIEPKGGIPWKTGGSIIPYI